MILVECIMCAFFNNLVLCINYYNVYNDVLLHGITEARISEV